MTRGEHRATRVVTVRRGWGLLGVALALTACGAGVSAATPSPTPQVEATSGWEVAVPAPETTADGVGLRVVKGGAFCGRRGEKARTSKGTEMRCREAKDGRLRWMRPE